MVYSRNGRLPINYIKELRSDKREESEVYIVNVIKHLDGWYELQEKIAAEKHSLIDNFKICMVTQKFLCNYQTSCTQINDSN